MKQISTISLERLNNGAHFLYMTKISSRIKADGILTEKENTKELCTTFEAALLKEDECLKISRKSLLTDDIAANDNLRGQLYSGYRKIVSSYLGFPVENFAKAAKVLDQHIKDYGIDPKMQLDKETGYLNSFLADLGNKYSEQVALLGLADMVAQLSSVNAKLQILTDQRTAERTTYVVGALKTAREACDNAYRAIVQMVNALTLVEGEATYADFIDYVNTEIAHYKLEVINGRASSTTTTTTEEEGKSDKN